MSDVKFKKDMGHQVYKLKDGTRVPGVTTISGMLDKPALVGWANRLGLQGIDVKKYVDTKAEIGTCCHYMIECHLNGVEPDLSEFSPKVVDQAENGFIKFLDWLQGMEAKHGKFHLIGTEIQFVSERYRYGGTIDIYGYFAKEDPPGHTGLAQCLYTLIDIKTSGSGIWPEMELQVGGGYKQLLEENDQRVDKTIIVRVGRDPEEGFEDKEVMKCDKRFEVFEHLLDIYRLNKELGGRE